MNARLVKATLLFALSYVFLYFIYAWVDFLPKWDAFGVAFLHGQAMSGFGYIDPLFLLAPLVGFILVWLGMDAYLRHFRDTFVLSIPFALLYILASYVAYFIALVGYYWNNAYLVALAQGTANPGLSSFGPTLSFVFQHFMDYLLQSPFFVIVLGGLAGWLSFVLIHSLWEESHPHIPRKSAPAVHSGAGDSTPAPPSLSNV